MIRRISPSSSSFSSDTPPPHKSPFGEAFLPSFSWYLSRSLTHSVFRVLSPSLTFRRIFSKILLHKWELSSLFFRKVRKMALLERHPHLLLISCEKTYCSSCATYIKSKFVKLPHCLRNLPPPPSTAPPLTAFVTQRNHAIYSKGSHNLKLSSLAAI